MQLLERDVISSSVCENIIADLPADENIKPLDLNNPKYPIGEWRTGSYPPQKIAVDAMPDILDEVYKMLGNQNYICDKMYVTKYNEGQICKNHTDPTDVTAIILLNDNFTGGDFVLNRRKLRLRRGDILLFGKNTDHAVLELTSGTRYALNVWLYKTK